MITLHTDDLKKLYQHGEQEYPDECCGVIIGDFNDATKNELIRCNNIQHELKERFPDTYTRDADTGYFMDPKDLIGAFKHAESKNLKVIAFYHSHPEHEAYWSREDHRAAMWGDTDEPSYPDAYHIVISVMKGIGKSIAVYRWDEKAQAFAKQDIPS